MTTAQQARTVARKRTAALERAATYAEELRQLAPRLVAEGMTKRDAARLLGVTRPTLYAWLDGQG